VLRLRVKAPFAAFRPFTTGAFRPTAPFLTPSAAYGLILNVAGIESRCDGGFSVMTRMRSGLPRVELAIGTIRWPIETHSIYQQLHNYPVGSTGQETDAKSGEKGPPARAKGNKYNIQPVRREFLSGIDAYICLRKNEDLAARVRAGLREGARSRVEGRPRYGIPFLGDNNFMVDVLREETEGPNPARWLVRVKPSSGMKEEYFRLTVSIDRSDNTRTRTECYRWTEEPQTDPPEEGWTVCGSE